MRPATLATRTSFHWLTAIAVCVAGSTGAPARAAPQLANFALKSLDRQSASDFSPVAPSAAGSPSVGGSTLLNESVSADPFSGAFRMRVTLDVPVGRGGMTPRLELNYDSSATAETIVAPHWVLSVPRVVRDTSVGIDFSGNAFVFESGINATVLTSIGSDQFVERVRSSAFMRFERTTASGTPAPWMLVGKDGSKLHFGLSQPARVSDPVDPQRVVAWLAERSEDINGNTIAYEYEKHGNVPRLVRISYASNGARTADKEIEFEYEVLALPKRSLRWGFELTFDARIKAIHSYVNVKRVIGMSPVRERYVSYVLNYASASSDSPMSIDDALIGIERVGAGTTKETLYKFEYLPTAVAIEQSVKPSAANGGLRNASDAPWISTAKPQSIAYIDIDGDGQTDVCGRTPHGHYCSLSKDNEEFAPITGANTKFSYSSKLGGAEFADSKVGSRPPPIVEREDDKYKYLEWDPNSDPRERLDGSLRYLDLNGDGSLDICGLNQSGLSCLVAGQRIATPPDFKEAKWWAPKRYTSFRTGDVDGNGTDELCALADGNFTCWTLKDQALTLMLTSKALAAGYWSDPGFLSSINLVDVNGDLRADLCGRATDGLRCWLSDGSAFAAQHPVLADLSSTWNSPQHYRNIRYGDINGDGAIDVCALRSEISCWLGSPQGFRDSVTLEANLSGWNEEKNFATLRMIDLNGDGRSDLCARQMTKLVCWLSRGTSFSAGFDVLPALDPAVWDNVDVLRSLGTPDMDGDGNREVCLVFAGALSCWSNRGSAPGILEAIQNRYGERTTLEFKSAPRTHQNQIPFAHPVLSTIVRRDGFGGMAKTLLAYSGGYYSKLSRDFRGFREVTRVDEWGMTLARVELSPDFPGGEVTRVDEWGMNSARARQAAPPVAVLRSSATVITFHQGDALGNRDAPVAYMKGLPRALISENDAGHQKFSFGYYPPDAAETLSYFTPLYEQVVAICDGIACKTPQERRLLGQSVTGRDVGGYDFGPLPDPGLPPGLGGPNGGIDLGPTELERSLYKAKMERWSKRFRRFRTEFAYDSYANVVEEAHFGDVDDPTDDRRVVRDYVVLAGGLILNRIGRETWFDGLSGDAKKVREITLRYDEFPLTEDVVADCKATFDGGGNDAKGNLTSIVSWLDRKDLARTPTDPLQSFAYDRFGNVRCKRDAAGSIHTANMDSSATYARFLIDPFGHQVAVELQGVDGFGKAAGMYGQIGRITNPNKAAVNLEYDDLGRLARQIQPNGHRTEFDYQDVGDASKQKVKVTDSLGNHRNYRFDGAGRIRSMRWNGPEGRTIEQLFEFDDRGYRIGSSVPQFVDQKATPMWLRQRWDSNGRLVTVKRPGGRSSVSCYEDWQVHSVDEKGTYRRVTFDSRRRIQEAALFEQPVDPRLEASAGKPRLPVDEIVSRNVFEQEICMPKLRQLPVYSVSSYSYDSLDRLIAIVGPRKSKTSIEFDSLNRLIRVADPDRGVWRYEQIDGQGRAGKVNTALGAVILREFDAVGRVTSRTVVGQPDLNAIYTYDDIAQPYGIGHLASAAGGNTQDRFVYDIMGQVQHHTRHLDGNSFEFSNAFDPLGRLLKRTYPDGRILHITYDAMSRKAIEIERDNARLPVVSFDSFLPTGDATEMRYANGARTLTTFSGFGADACSEPTLEICKIVATSAQGTPIVDLGYQFSAGGALLLVNDSKAGAQQFRYDAWNRLHVATGSAFDAPVTFEYDNANRITSGPAGTYVYPAPGTEAKRGATRVGNYSLTYDAAGSVTSIDSQSSHQILRYDQLGRVSSMESARSAPDTNRSTVVAYDWRSIPWARNRTINGSGSKTVYPTRDYECTGEECTIVVRGGTGQYARLATQESESRYFVNDHLGSVIASIDEGGFEREQYRYKPFGVPFGNAKPADGERGFLGEQIEGEGATYLLGPRAYHPAFGVFLGADPVLGNRFNPLSISPYAYALNNPLTFVDPWGWEAQPYFHPGATMIVTGAVTIGGIVLFGTFAAIPATAAGAVLLAMETIGLSAAGAQIVLGAMSFMSSRQDALAVSEAMGAVPSSASQFIALPLAIATGTSTGYGEVMNRASALEVLTGTFNVDPVNAGEKLYNFAAFGVGQFMERVREDRANVGGDRAGLQEARLERAGDGLSRERGGNGVAEGRVSVGNGDRGTIEMINRESGARSGKSDLGPAQPVGGDKPDSGGNDDIGPTHDIGPT